MSNPFDQFDEKSAAGAANPFDQFDEGKKKKSGSLLTGLGDSAAALGSGLVSGVQMLTNVAGADNKASKLLGDTAASIRELESPERKAERQARAEKIRVAEDSGSTWEEIKANVGAFADAPVDTTLEVLGNTAPTLAAAALTGGQSAAAQIAARSAPIVMGAAQGAGAVKGQIYDTVEQELKGSGLSEEAAASRAAEAQSYAGQNAGNIALGAGLGAVAGGTGAERAIGRILSQKAGERASAGLLKSAALGALKEAPVEMVQGGQERYASNVALQREGFDVPTWQGVAGQAAFEGVAGGVIGGGFGAGEAMYNGSRYAKRKLEDEAPKDEIAGLLPAPTYTGTPGDQLVSANAERQAAIDAAAVYAAREAFERDIRQAVTIINEPAPLQQRIDEMLNVDTSKLSGLERTNYEKALASAFNEPIGIRQDENGIEVPFTMGEYLDAQVAAEDAVRTRPLKQGAAQSASARLQQVADEESTAQPDIAAPSIPVVGPLSAAANMAVQTGVAAASPLQQETTNAAALDEGRNQGQGDNQAGGAGVARPGGNVSGGILSGAGASAQRSGADSALGNANTNGLGALNGLPITQQVATQAPQATGPQATAQQGAAPQGQVAGPDVSGRTDKQLDHLVANGSTQEVRAAAKAEIAKRKGSSAQVAPSADAAPAAKASTLSVGSAPGSADPITVKDGVVYIGNYPAQNFDTGEDVTVSPSATPQQIVFALKDSGAISPKQKVFGLEATAPEDVIGWTQMTAAQREGLVYRAGYAGANGKLNLAGVRIVKTAWASMSQQVRDKLIAASQMPAKVADQPSAETVTAPAEAEASNSADAEVFERQMRASATAERNADDDIQTTGMRFVSFAKAMEIARAAVAAGVRQAPAQFHTRLDVTMDSADRLIAGLSRSDKLPSGWSESAPGGMATNNNPETGGIVDQQAVGGKWFGVANKDGIGTLEGFDTRAEALAALDTAASQPKTDAAPEAKQGNAPAVTPQHIEKGEAEAATAPVVAQALKKGAANSSLDLREQRELLLKKIDAAIAAAPTAAEKDAWDSINQKIDLKNNMRVEESIGYRVFEVPGDGKFKILNLKEALQRFRDRVEANPGFKKPANTTGLQKVAPWQRTTTGGTEAATKELLEAGEYSSAVEYAKQIDKPLIFGQYQNGSAITVYTEAKPFEREGYDDFKMVSARNPQGGDKVAWAVIDLGSGLTISSNHPSRLKAIAETNKALAKMTPEQLATAVKSAKANTPGLVGTQEELEQRWLTNVDQREADAQGRAEQEHRKGLRSHRGMLADATGKTVEEAGKTAAKPTEEPKVDYKGFERITTSDGAFDLRDGNMTVKVEPTTKGKYQASFRSAKSSPHLVGEQGAVDWAASYRNDAMTQKPVESAKPAKAAEQAPADVSKNPQKANTSSEPVQKTAGNEQVEPNPLDHTPNQYHEARLKWMAERNGAPLSEVRENYDTDAGRKESDGEWVDAVRQAFKNGAELNRATLDKLEEIRPGAVSAFRHDYPEAKVPNGYQTPEARSVEKQNKADRQEDRKAIAAERKPAEDGKPDNKADVAKPSATADAGEELTYNKRNRRTGGVKWDDIKDKNAALRVKEVVKSKVYPKPDYQAMVDGGMKDVVAHIVKQAYDAIAPAPKLKRGVEPSDAVLQSYIAAVNRVMDGVMKWASDDVAIAKWAEKQSKLSGQPFSISELTTASSLLDTVYPNGWKASREELIMLGGNKFLSKLQPGYDEVGRAMKDIKLGWPASAEAWQKQGMKVVHVDTLTIDLYSSPAKPNRGAYVSGSLSVGNQRIDTFVLDGTDNKQEKVVQEIVADRKRELEGKYVLLDKASRPLGVFDSEESAIESAREKAKKETGEKISEKGVSVETAERVGIEHRLPGDDVTSERLKETFGFRGVNFGNWMQGDTKAKVAERQLHLNHLYDAFMDLAQLLNLPPKAMSLNGMLGIAVGAQGSGKALAHFVPGVNEINVTRTKGAGALAHEWGHALDHYFAAMGGLDRKAEPYLSAHVGTLDSRVVDGKYVRTPIALADVRPEVAGQFQSIVEAMTKRKETKEEYESRLKSSNDIAAKLVATEIKKITDAIDKAKSTWGTPALAEKIRGLADRIAKLDYGDGRVAILGGEAPAVVAEIGDAYLAAAGAPLDNAYALGYHADRYKVVSEMLESSEKWEPATVQTDYQKTSDAADAKKKKYWSTKLEMFARAFDAYVVDSLAEKEGRNTYLSGIESVAPQGDERKAIGRAFDFLFAELKTKETESGTAIYNISAPSTISPADKAIYGMAAEGKSATDILKFIASASRSPFNRQVAKLLLKTGIVPKVMVSDSKGWKFNAGEGNKYAAAYNPTTDTVALFRPAAAERNMLHELVHAATIKALSGKGMAAAQMNALYKHVKKTGKLKGMYGMSDIDEFIAEAFANPKFQEKLKAVSAPSGGNKLATAWDWLIRVVRGILGLPANQDSALSRALEIGVGVMREDMKLRNNDAGVPFAEITGKEVERTLGRNLQEKARNWMKANLQGKSFRNDATGWDISVGRKGVSKTMMHAAKDVHAKSVAAIPSLLKNAVLVSSEENKNAIERKAIPIVHHLYAPLLLDGNKYIARLVIKEATDGTRFYDFDTSDEISPANSAISGRLPKEEPASGPSLSKQGGTVPSARLNMSMSELLSYVKAEHGGTDPRFTRYTDVGKVRGMADKDTVAGQKQTESAAFRKWFGDSKVVDSNGEPLVVYHGTNKDIKKFQGGRGSDAIWFAEDTALANLFVGGGRANMAAGAKKGSAVYPVYLRSENPLDLGSASPGDMASVTWLLREAGLDFGPDTLQKIAKQNLESGYVGVSRTIKDPVGYLVDSYYEKSRLSNLLDNKGLIAHLAEQGYTGFRMQEEGSVTHAVFSPAQIKSAIGNSGDFDGTNPDIRYNVADDGWSVAEQAKEAVMRLAGRPMLDPSDPFAAENARLREQDQSLWSKAKKQLRRYLAPGGLLPQSVFAEKIKRDSEFQAVEFDIRHLIGGLEQAVKADYGMAFDKLSNEQMRPITEALAGNVPASLPEATKTAAIAMRQYIDGMSTEYLKIIQEKIDAKMLKALESGKDADKSQAINDIELFEKIKGNIGRYVHRSYQAFDDPKWFEKVPAPVLNASRLYLKQGYLEAGETDAKAAQLAEVTLHEILKNGTAYDSMESFIAESKLGAKDLSVLMRRKEVPAQIRALLGEYPDARLNFTKSATKMGRLIWNTRFLERVRDIGMGSFFFDGKDRPPAATTQIAADGSEVYAPLNGLWTFPEIAQAFKDALGKEQMSDLYRAIVRANGIVKYGKTVLSPTTAMRNWQSAMFFSLANGHFDLTQMKKSISAFREQVSQKATGGDLKYLRHLKQLGVVYDTPYAGEMARLMEDARMEELLSSEKGDAVRWFRKANQMAQGFYTFGDDFWKIIGFENEKAGLMKAGLTLQEAEVEAAKRIRDTYPTYSMVGRGIQWLSRFPLAGTFVSFPAEIVRTSGNMLRTVAADLKSDNPKLRELGMRRAAGMVFVSSAFYGLAALSMAMAGVGDDEDEAIRDLAPEWQKNSTFLYLGRDEKGNLRYFDLSFLDPYGYWKRPLTAMMRNQPWEDSLASGLRGMLEPFLGTDIAAGAIFEAVANQKESGGKVYKEKDSAIDQTIDIADHLRKALQPGFVGNAERLVKAAADVRRSSGQPYSMEDEIVALAGWRASTIDTKTALYYRSFEFTDAIAEARKTVADTLRNANSVSAEDIADAKMRGQAKQDQAFKQMSRLVGAAEAAGLSRSQIIQTLRLSNISQANIAYLMRGSVPDVSITPQMALRAFKQANEMRGREFADEVLSRYRQAMAN